MTKPKRAKPYDYEGALYGLTAKQYIDDGRAKKILRKLVREAVREVFDVGGHDTADRIAKKLVP